MADSVEWPTYETPAGIGRDATAVPPTGDTSSASPGTPPESAAPVSDDQTPPADGAAEPQAPGNDDNISIPKHRFDEVNSAYQALYQQTQSVLAQNARLTEIVNRLAPGSVPAAPAAAEPEPLTENEQRIVAQLERLLQRTGIWNKISPLIDKNEVLLQLANEIPQQRESEQQHWTNVAERWLGTVVEQTSKAIFGKDFDISRIEPDRARIIRQGFTAFVERDPQRVARYEAGDGTLVNDFIGWFRGFGGTVTPQDRRQAAAQQARADGVKKLPTAGPAGSPVSTAPPKINNKDEEAVHSAGWAAFQSAVGAGR